MKIEQNKGFQPISIILDTREDVDLFWQILKYDQGVRSDQANAMAIAINKYFNEEADFSIRLNK